MQSGLTVGDEVMLTSGIIGVLRSLDEETVDLEVSEGVTVRVVRAAVGQVMTPVARDDNTELAVDPAAEPEEKLSRWHATALARDAPSRCSSSVLAVAYGLVALIGTWKPALGLDLEGGTQITLTAYGQRQQGQPQPGRQHHRRAGQRLGCLRGRGDDAGQQRDRRPGARQHQEQPGADRDPAGAPPLPAGRPGAADDHAADTGAVVRRVADPGPRGRRHAAAGDRVDEGRQRQAEGQVRPATTARRRCSGKNKQDPKKNKDKNKPSSSPTPDAHRKRPGVHVAGGLHRGEQEGVLRRPDLDDQPRPAVGGGLQRLHAAPRRRRSSTTRPSRS